MNDHIATTESTIELMSRRRSVGVALLHEPAPSGAEIETLLRLASRVPDHAKVVPWRFIVLGPDGGARIGETVGAAYVADHPEADAEKLAVERGRLQRAPLVIAVVSSPREHPKAPEWEQILSTGAACMSLVIAANAMGYSTNWLTEWVAFDRRVLGALGLASHERIAGFIYIGTADERAPDRPRPELSTIVTWYGADGPTIPLAT